MWSLSSVICETDNHKQIEGSLNNQYAYKSLIKQKEIFETVLIDPRYPFPSLKSSKLTMSSLVQNLFDFWK